MRQEGCGHRLTPASRVKLMPTLDAQTLFVVIILIYWLMGVLILVAALHGRNGRTLLWSALANVFNGLAFLVGFVSGTHYWGPLSIWLSNILLITGYGCVWTSLRSFAGRPPHWLALSGGAIIWFALCAAMPSFMDAVYWRIVAFSALTLIYLLAALVELRSCLDEDRLSISTIFAIVSLHMLFYAFRMMPLQGPGPTWLGRSDFGLTILENMLFIVSLSFAILIMVRARGERQFRYASRHDELTGLSNRRVMFEQGSRSLAERRVPGEDMAVLMCDLDKFKRINDRYGHQIGDRILVLFANILRQTTRETDLCARIGGEEFIVLALTQNPQGAELLANRIRKALAAASSSETGPLSVSIGVACASTVGDHLGELLSRADQALYAAKHAGRDRVCVWTPSFDTASSMS